MDTSFARLILLGLAAVITFMSVYGMLVPDRLVSTVERTWRKPWSLLLAVGVRVVLGATLVVCAPVSRLPAVFLWLGWLMLLAAAALPLVGRERIGLLLERVGLWPRQGIRCACLAGVAFGMLIAYGVM